MKFLDYYGLSGIRHKDINFFNSDIYKDAAVFIDPFVITSLTDPFCLAAKKSIESFFHEVVSACKLNNMARLYQLFEHASEPNETNLGLRRKSNYGKGSTSEELSPLFLEFYNVTCQHLNPNTGPLFQCMYLRNFDADKMSDLITNVIRRHLSEFTVEQCRKMGIPLSNYKVFIGYYWDIRTLQWKELFEYVPIVDSEKKILLVPKNIIRKKLSADVSRFISMYIFRDLQKWHLTNNTPDCHYRELKNGKIKVFPPTKEELGKKELKNITYKDYARNFSEGCYNCEQEFFNDLTTRLRNGYGKISDEELDMMIDRNHRKLS